MKSVSKELFGHSIKNPQIKHLLVHELDYNPFGAIHASVIIHYLCMGACGITPEKSTWKLEEVTCKNCLRDVKTVLHKKDYRGMVKAIYDGELYDYIPDCNLPPFCDTCMHENGALCDWLHKCPYNQLMNRMKNGLKDCPECGGEKELIKTIPYYPILDTIGVFPSIPIVHIIKVYKCKLCGHTW